MAKAKRAIKSGDLVRRIGSDSVYVITRLSVDGTQVDLCLKDTDIEWFRVPITDIVLAE